MPSGLYAALLIKGADSTALKTFEYMGLLSNKHSGFRNQVLNWEKNTKMKTPVKKRKYGLQLSKERSSSQLRHFA